MDNIIKKIGRNLLNIPEIIYRLFISKKLKVNYLLHIRGKIRIVGEKYITIGKGFCADSDVKIEAWNHHLDEKYEPEITIGDYVFFNSRTHISAINKIYIGNAVLLGSDVFISDNNHGSSSSIEELKVAPQKRKLSSKGPVIIEDNVWIGDKAVILGGVTIGFGAVIGACSVVTKSIPPFSIAVGNPARIIKQMSEEEK